MMNRRLIWLGCAATLLTLVGACSQEPQSPPKNDLRQIDGCYPVEPITAVPTIKTLVHGGCQGITCTNTYLILTEGERKCFVLWGPAQSNTFAGISIQTNQEYRFHLTQSKACAGPTPHTITKIELSGETIYDKETSNN